MRLFRWLGLVATVLLLTALAGPANAARVTHESYTLTGVTAEATFFSEDGQEPDVGIPRVLYAMGADATTVHRVPGAKPERTRQPAILAMGLIMPGIAPADEPYQAELWCVTEDFTFTIADDLSEAALQIPTCEAQVIVFDPQTGEEVPNGVTVTLAATTRWAATGPLETQRSHSRYAVGGSWTMDLSRTSMRPATADITVSGLPSGTFEASTQEAVLQTLKVATFQHQ
ncbi:hypothetical protein GCM10009841_33040 [Microlunatus panaciterrae]|uniref:Uncharacterized protein n=1 Tax=Microlunatus panaciterrae TaxID=400768 RepID=A0ABS2RHF2_9ACTN|nr:hypothetical protein [Microlunatus panaciterrae]MBM7797962.1 hypothetical protein [Microlunatus panaciterrae]